MKKGKTGKKLRIAVTGMNATDSPGPGVAVIRAIRCCEEFAGEIVGLTYDPLDPGVFMENICDHVYLMPYPSEGAPALFNRLCEIHQKTPVDVLIPTLDAELAPLLNIEKELVALGIKMFLPTREGLELRSKARFDEMGKKLNISVPRSKTISDPALLRTLDQEFTFPVMVKGQFYEAYVAYSPVEADHHFRKLSAKWGLPVIIQEFILGEEYDVVVLGDGEGGLVGAVPMKKMQLTDKGKAWGGVTIMDPAMNDFVREVMAKIKWRGPCELEIMKSSKDGKYYIFEINPRFPAWCFLAVGAGQNLQWATVKLALGERVAHFKNYKVGALFLRNSNDYVYPLSEYQAMTTVGELHRK
jgi:carbamoyl-phosphate synthase large subunit